MSIFSWFKEVTCKHHFKLDTLQRDSEKQLSFMRCAKCNKLFEEYYGYMILSHGTFEPYTSYSEHNKFRDKVVESNLNNKQKD